jgi:hypothetical protein
MYEIWKDIKEYEGKYQVSNLGNVRSLNYNKTNTVKLLKTYTNKNKYVYVTLGQNNTYRVHRLVAEAFIPNPDNLPYINHKDENPSNNHVDNLEWCTQKYNVNYGNCLIKRSKHFINYEKYSYKVDVYNLNNEFIETLPSISECCRKYNLKSKSKVIACCNGGTFRKNRNKWVNTIKYKNFIFKWHCN